MQRIGSGFHSVSNSSTASKCSSRFCCLNFSFCSNINNHRHAFSIGHEPTIPITPVEPIPTQSVVKEEVLELNDLQDKVTEPCTTPTDSIQSQQTELASSQMTTALSVGTTASMITVSLLPTATDSDAVDDPSVRMMLRLKHMQSDMELFRDLWKKSVEARATGAKPIPFQTSVSSTKPAVPSTPVLPIVSSACSLKVTART